MINHLIIPGLRLEVLEEQMINHLIIPGLRLELMEEQMMLATKALLKQTKVRTNGRKVITYLPDFNQ